MLRRRMVAWLVFEDLCDTGTRSAFFRFVSPDSSVNPACLPQSEKPQPNALKFFRRAFCGCI